MIATCPLPYSTHHINTEGKHQQPWTAQFQRRPMSLLYWRVCCHCCWRKNLCVFHCTLLERNQQCMSQIVCECMCVQIHVVDAERSTRLCCQPIWLALTFSLVVLLFSYHSSSNATSRSVCGSVVQLDLSLFFASRAWCSAAV